MGTALVWFRHDLRLADHAALHRAVDAHGTVVPTFVWAPDEEGDWPPGGAHRWWLHHSLKSLADDLGRKGSRLILRHGPSLEALRDVAKATGAEAVYWHRRYEPALRARDEQVAEALRQDGLTVEVFDGYLLHDPDEIETTSGGPYHVYGPFWRRLKEELDVGSPLPVPGLGASKAPAAWPDAAPLDSLELTPLAQDGVDWATAFDDVWRPGESGGQYALASFVEERLLRYGERRDRPDRPGTARLSPHLHHGEVSPRQVWHAADGWVQNGAMRETADKFLSEIAWREFSYHLLWHYPSLPEQPLKEEYAAFPFRDDEEALRRWQRGQTGYPIVDAGMRELWAIGWMHNRARLLTASFLTKHLLIDWREGERWFWDTLCGGDLANNAMSWQWIAGSGADAQPFFRIFNPISQAERYDPDGAYVRRWVPELSELPDKHLHRPWEAPDDVLREAGVELGATYPAPIVDHAEARERALEAYEQVKQASG